MSQMCQKGGMGRCDQEGYQRVVPAVFVSMNEHGARARYSVVERTHQSSLWMHSADQLRAARYQKRILTATTTIVVYDDEHEHKARLTREALESATEELA